MSAFGVQQMMHPLRKLELDRVGSPGGSCTFCSMSWVAKRVSQEALRWFQVIRNFPFQSQRSFNEQFLRECGYPNSLIVYQTYLSHAVVRALLSAYYPPHALPSFHEKIKLILEARQLAQRTVLKQDPFLVTLRAVHIQLAKECGLFASHWNPSRSFYDLTNEIFLRGPMVIFGYFGEDYYVTPPCEEADQSVKGGKLWYWVHPQKNNRDSSTHAVVVVGFRNLRGHKEVFFQDPNEPEKLYKISYDRLKRNIIPFMLDEHFKRTPLEPHLLQCLPYGFHATSSARSVD